MEEQEKIIEIPRAKITQEYYIIANDFTVIKTIDFRGKYDNAAYKAYNYFTSEIQAKRFASKMQDYLIELWKEELLKCK